jgi:hypothetical protein
MDRAGRVVQAIRVLLSRVGESELMYLLQLGLNIWLLCSETGSVFKEVCAGGSTYVHNEEGRSRPLLLSSQFDGGQITTLMERAAEQTDWVGT